MVLKHERGNRLAKEALEKFRKSKNIEKELRGRFKKKGKRNRKVSEYMMKAFQRPQMASNDGSEIGEDSLRGSVANTVIPGMGRPGEGATELQGISGALILVFRIACDIVGGVIGYGILSPTYYKYF